MKELPGGDWSPGLPDLAQSIGSTWRLMVGVWGGDDFSVVTLRHACSLC